VQRSVLFRGVEVQAGAEVQDAVVLPGAVIGRGSRLRGVIVDSGYRVPDDTVIDRSEQGTLPIERVQPAVLVRHDDRDGEREAA